MSQKVTSGLQAATAQPADLPHVAADGLRFELAAAAAGIGTFEWDLATNELTWDARLRALLGFEAEEPATVQRFVGRILPADQPAVEHAAAEAIRVGGQLRIDFRIIDTTGATHWLTTRGQVIRDAAGRGQRMLGAIFDTSNLRPDREQVARALDTMATAYATVDRDWTVRYANQAARALLPGREPVGNSVWELMPSLADQDIANLLRGVMDGGQHATVELDARRRSRRLEMSVQPISDGIAVLINDVTQRRQAEDEATRAAARVALLAEAGTALVQRRPVPETVEAGLGLLVPRLARAAMISLRDGTDRRHTLVGLRHENPEEQADLRTLFEAIALGDDPSTLSGRAVATGSTQIIGDFDEALIHRATEDPQLQERLRALEATGVLAVPLISRGESIGFIGLVGRDGSTPSGPDLVLIEDIASRLASAIDNAQIFGQVQQARTTAELVTGRLEFLASISDALGSTLDAEKASERLARMLVPTLADWAMVTLLDDEGRVEDIASNHVDPSQQPLLDRYVSSRRESLVADPSLIGEVVAAGQPLFQLDQAGFFTRLRGDQSEEALAQLAPGAVTALPILARDRALGVISLYNRMERGRPSDQEMEAAREVARRAGLVLDNARLYARSRSMAETLQRSLLTPPVHPPDLQVVTRYVPAIADAQVGGDWYDAFHSGDGTTTLVIGDVMGHDTEAAALMGQLRTLVRAIAVDRRESPGAVLSRVDAAAATLGLDTTATAVLAQVLEGSSTARGRRLRWSNAGHPPPVLLEESGAVSFLDAPADLLLGLGAHFRRTDHVVDLPPGSTVLLFTDGLVEGRAQPLDVGLRQLAIAGRPLTGLPLDVLCDRLLSALLPNPGAEDDVALVAVRVSPAGQPAAQPSEGEPGS